MAELNALSETDSANTNISGADTGEGCSPAGINDAIRNFAGMSKRAYDRDHAGSWVTVGGSANAITLSYSASPTSLVQGEKFAFKVATTNTGPVTVQVGSLPATNLYKPSPTGPIPLTGSELTVGQIVEIEYDGTQFQIICGIPPVISSVGYLRGYLSGCILSNDATTPNTKLDVSAGIAMDSTNTFLINLPATVINFGVTGAGGLDAGSIAAATWYHVFAIAKADGTASAIVSTSASSPTMPSGYTYKRRIGSARSDVSSHLNTFSQLGDEFLWTGSSSPWLDVNAVTLAATAQTKTLTVPTGVQVYALFHAFIRDDGTTSVTSCVVTALDEADQSGSLQFDLVTPGTTSGYGAGNFRIRTNTSAQIRVRGSGTAAALTISTRGWIDDRGKLA